MSAHASHRTLRYRMIRLSWIMVGGLLAASYLSVFLLLHHEVGGRLDQSLMDAALPVREHFEANRDKTMADLGEFGGPGRYFEVLDLQGRVLQRSRDLAQDLPSPVSVSALAHLASPVFATAAGAEHQLRLVALPFTRGTQPTEHYVLLAAISTFGYSHVLDLFGQIIAVLLPLSLLFAGLISAWYVDRSLVPIRVLTGHAEQMAERAIHPGAAGASELWQPLPVSPNQDELSRLTATFNRLFAHADAVLRQMRQFVTDASHEIRTPLAILRGETELLLAGDMSAAEVRRALDGMDHDLRRLTRIVEGLFTLSMADAGQLRLMREPLFLNEQLEAACAFVRPRAEARRIRIERDLAAEVPFRGDEAILHELFVIFLDNAIKYSPPGSSVRVGLEPEKEWVQIWFEDEGPGVAAGERERIFERFYRAPAARGEAGSGLGLAIAVALAGAHGGRAEYADGASGGSRFLLRLPRDPARFAAAVQAAPSGARTSVAVTK
ncbi:MAG: sensor histidine kinase [Terriglobales bacterium]